MMLPISMSLPQCLLPLDIDPYPTHPPPMATKFLANFEKLIILLLCRLHVGGNNGNEHCNDDIANYVATMEQTML
jgi:hypothetical protein